MVPCSTVIFAAVSDGGESLVRQSRYSLTSPALWVSGRCPIVPMLVAGPGTYRRGPPRVWVGWPAGRNLGGRPGPRPARSGQIVSAICDVSRTSRTANHRPDRQPFRGRRAGGPGGLLVSRACDIEVEDVLVLVVVVVAELASCKFVFHVTLPVPRARRSTHDRHDRKPKLVICMGVCVLCFLYSRYFKTVCIQGVCIHIVTAMILKV